MSGRESTHRLGEPLTLMHETKPLSAWIHDMSMYEWDHSIESPQPAAATASRAIDEAARILRHQLLSNPAIQMHVAKLPANDVVGDFLDNRWTDAEDSNGRKRERISRLFVMLPDATWEHAKAILSNWLQRLHVGKIQRNLDHLDKLSSEAPRAKTQRSGRVCIDLTEDGAAPITKKARDTKQGPRAQNGQCVTFPNGISGVVQDYDAQSRLYTISYTDGYETWHTHETLKTGKITDSECPKTIRPGTLAAAMQLITADDSQIVAIGDNMYPNRFRDVAFTTVTPRPGHVDAYLHFLEDVMQTNVAILRVDPKWARNSDEQTRILEKVAENLPTSNIISLNVGEFNIAKASAYRALLEAVESEQCILGHFFWEIHAYEHIEELRGDASDATRRMKDALKINRRKRRYRQMVQRPIFCTIRSMKTWTDFTSACSINDTWDRVADDDPREFVDLSKKKRYEALCDKLIASGASCTLTDTFLGNSLPGGQCVACTDEHSVKHRFCHRKA